MIFNLHYSLSETSLSSRLPPATLCPLLLIFQTHAPRTDEIKKLPKTTTNISGSRSAARRRHARELFEVCVVVECFGFCLKLVRHFPLHQATASSLLTHFGAIRFKTFQWLFKAGGVGEDSLAGALVSPLDMLASLVLMDLWLGWTEGRANSVEWFSGSVVEHR